MLRPPLGNDHVRGSRPTIADGSRAVSVAATGSYPASDDVPPAAARALFQVQRRLVQHTGSNPAVVRYTPAAVVGQAEVHLCSQDDESRVGARIHYDAVDPFLRLRAAAAREGFSLTILSGYRSFEKQLSIWNRKASGELAVLDRNACPLDITRLAPEDLVFAILRWSALPGASRHHWGTDIDVYDAATKPRDYEVELVPAEVERGGMFAPLHEWLDARIADGSAFGFSRPYDRDRGGVAPERWHLSYLPVAAVYARLLTPEVLRQAIAGAEMLLKDVVLAHLEAIYERFVTNVNPEGA